MRLTDQQLAEIEARAEEAKGVLGMTVWSDRTEHLPAALSHVHASSWHALARPPLQALAADASALLDEVKALRAQRAALAGVLAAVETPAHNAAVLRSRVDVLDYTHGMESLDPAPAVEAR